MSLPKPYYQDDWCTIYHGDCREILPQLEPVDLVLTDPPYGIDWNTDYTRFTNGMRSGQRKKYDKIQNDNNPDIQDVVFGDWELICWGAHLFPWKIKNIGSWLVWDKRFDNGTAMLADAELAYWNHGHGTYIFKHTWQGMIKDKSSIPSVRMHPNEKPVPLLKWCINLVKSKGVVVDPFMGSGTTLRAAKDLGRKAIGIEIEEKYCEVAVERLRQEVLAL